MALAACTTEYAIPHLTPNQLDLTSKIISALSPIKDITKSYFYRSSICLSDHPFYMSASKDFGEPGG